MPKKPDNPKSIQRNLIQQARREKREERRRLIKELLSRYWKPIGAGYEFFQNNTQIFFYALGLWEARKINIQFQLIQTDIKEIYTVMDNQHRKLEDKVEKALRPSLFNDFIKPIAVNAGVEGIRTVSSLIFEKQFFRSENQSLNHQIQQLNQRNQQLEKENNELKKTVGIENQLRAANSSFADQNLVLKSQVEHLEHRIYELQGDLNTQRNLGQRLTHNFRKNLEDRENNIRYQERRVRQMRRSLPPAEQLSLEPESNQKQSSQSILSKIGFPILRATVVKSTDVIMSKAKEPPSDAKEQYKYDKKRDADRKKETARFYNNVKNFSNNTTNRIQNVSKQTLENLSNKSQSLKKVVQKKSPDKNKKKKTKSKEVVFYPFYGAHHSKESKDQTTEKYNTILKVNPKKSSRPSSFSILGLSKKVVDKFVS